MNKRIVLFCAGGMSTSLLVSKMRELAKENKEEYDIEAYGIAELDKQIMHADVVLLGPQVSYITGKINAEYPSAKVASIPMKMYAMMDGDSILQLAEKRMGEK